MKSRFATVTLLSLVVGLAGTAAGLSLLSHPRSPHGATSVLRLDPRHNAGALTTTAHAG